MIDCHVVFNEPTDREDWLERCVASLQHPDVAIHVHRFVESAPVNGRRKAIFQEHDPSRWIMFADPDDFVVQPDYDQFVSAVLASGGDNVWCPEIILGRGEPDLNDRPHHFVALRGDAIAELLQHPAAGRAYYPFLVPTGERVVAAPYRWVDHGRNTRGRA
jgi:hypothetical protein